MDKKDGHTVATTKPETGASFSMRDRKLADLIKILALLCLGVTAVSSRLFSVVRFESIIHEFDPWFNYRASKKLVEDGFYEFWNWFDERSWYPLGRVAGGTLYPGLMVTSGIIHNFLRAINMPVDIRNVCVLLAPGFSALTALATYLLTCEIGNDRAGLLAAAFIAVVPGYISRSVAGSYDNEAIAIFLLMFTFFLWIRAQKRGSVFWAVMTAMFYFYMVAAWGGYVFITNMIPLHVFVLLLMGRYSSRTYVAYSTYYVLGLLASMQIPFVGFQPIWSSEHMAAFGVFGLLQLIAFADLARSYLSSKQFFFFLKFGIITVATIGALGSMLLTLEGKIAPWAGRFYSLWDTGYAKIHIPLIASVSEHQPTAWTAYFFDLQFLIWLFPAGIFVCFRELTDEHVFLILYAALASYFSGVMVRLMLTLAPCVCIASALIYSEFLDTYLKKSFERNLGSKSKYSPRISSPTLRWLVTGLATYFLVKYVQHCLWVTSAAYSSPSVVLQSKTDDGRSWIIDDFREAYYWLRQNTPYDARVMSWWDYGYQIAGMADRTTLCDNNTWNQTHIGQVGRMMASSEENAYPIMLAHDVDYVLVIFGGLLGYSGDDINKFIWMIRISGGIWPDQIQERNYFTSDGEYRVDDRAPAAMKESILYKMSYYRFHEAFPAGKVFDRVRGSSIVSKPVELHVLEEAFTSEHWMVRIYKVKKPDTLGRNLIPPKKGGFKHKKNIRSLRV